MTALLDPEDLMADLQLPLQKRPAPSDSSAAANRKACCKADLGCGLDKGYPMQMSRTKRGASMVALIFVAALLLGPASISAARAETINIAWTGESWSTLPLRVASDKGFFERENLQARFIYFQSIQLITNALMQGDIDYATTLAIAGAALRGLPLKIVGVVGKGTGYAIVSKREIETVKGLKGKKFALNSFGSAPDYAVYTFFSKNGLDPNRDVTFLTIGGTSARFAALVGGSVDATVVSSPFEYFAEQQGIQNACFPQGTSRVCEPPVCRHGGGARKNRQRWRANREGS